MSVFQENTPRVGDILSVPVPGAPYDHWGVVTNGGPYGRTEVISARLSAGRVVRETLREFAGEASLSDIENHGLWGASRTAVVNRARSRVGEGYHLLHSNCEHFVREVSGAEPESPQLQQWITSLVFLATIAMLARS